jgi:hypothetical protein
MNPKALIISLVLTNISLLTSAQQLITVSVTANGYGRTESLALADAVINGVAQVNGETVAASMRVTTTSSASTNGSESGSRTIEEDIQRRTRGVVKSWRPVSVNGTGSGDFSATAQVSVAVLKRSEQLKRMKLAIVPSKNGDLNLNTILASEITSNLTSSRKFAILDRRNSDAIAQQLGRIRNGTGSIEDQVRLTAEVAPDFLVIVTLEPVGIGSAKPSVLGSLEVIDYSSRQVKFSEKKSFPMKISDDASNRRRIGLLGKGLSRAVTQTVYPPIVLGLDENFITIGQGSDFFNKGDVLLIKKIGNPLRDPHTGEFLSNEKTDIGKAEVTYVDERIAKAKVLGNITLDQKLLAGKKYQVWRTGESSDDFFAGLGGGDKEDRKKSKKLFSTDDDED